MNSLILILLVIAFLAWHFFPIKENILTTSPGTLHQLVARHEQDKYLLTRPGEQISDFDPNVYYQDWAPFYGHYELSNGSLNGLDYYQKRMLTHGI